MSTAAAAGRLLIGNIDRAFTRTSGSGLEQRTAGRSDGGEVAQATCKPRADQPFVHGMDINLVARLHFLMVLGIRGKRGNSPRRLMPAELANPLLHQTAILLLLALPVACVAWTVTHEEVFREPREFCKQKAETEPALPKRKFFYLFTCEYCFSHYVAALALWLFRYRLLYMGWRGYVVAWFALVWIANVYMSLFNRLRLDIKHENVTIEAEENNLPEKLQPREVVRNRKA